MSPSIPHMVFPLNKERVMNATAAAILLTALVSLGGCANAQQQLHASIRKECRDRGLIDGTREFKDCFAKELHQEHGPEPGAKGVRDHGWKQDLE